MDFKDIKGFNEMIENMISLRINEIIKDNHFGIDINYKIKKSNDKFKNLTYVEKQNRKDNKIKKLSFKNIYIKDISRAVKNETHLNYLPDYIIIKVKNFEIKEQKEKIVFYNKIWNELEIKIQEKYKKLIDNYEDFTNEKYLEIVNKN